MKKFDKMIEEDKDSLSLHSPKEFKSSQLLPMALFIRVRPSNMSFLLGLIG